MKKRLTIYECVIRCERWNHVNSHYSDLCIYRPMDKKKSSLKKILVTKVSSTPATLFETSMKTSTLQSRFIGMTQECYDLPRMFLEKIYYPTCRNGLKITTTCATIYRGVYITVVRPFVAT